MQDSIRGDLFRLDSERATMPTISKRELSTRAHSIVVKATRDHSRRIDLTSICFRFPSRVHSTLASFESPQMAKSQQYFVGISLLN